MQKLGKHLRSTAKHTPGNQFELLTQSFRRTVINSQVNEYPYDFPFPTDIKTFKHKCVKNVLTIKNIQSQIPQNCLSFREAAVRSSTSESEAT